MLFAILGGGRLWEGEESMKEHFFSSGRGLFFGDKFDFAQGAQSAMP
jgi:hypothetical protein